jgi:hypothetical protein
LDQFYHFAQFNQKITKELDLISQTSDLLFIFYNIKNIGDDELKKFSKFSCLNNFQIYFILSNMFFFYLFLGKKIIFWIKIIY